MKERKWTDYFFEWVLQKDFPEDRKEEIIAFLGSCSERHKILKLVWERLKNDFSEQRKLWDEVFPFPIAESMSEEDKNAIIIEARKKLGDPERKTARDKATLKVQLDLEDLWIHTRILMDQMAYLAKFFLRNVESRSFNDHRKHFLEKKNIPFPEDEEYALYIRDKTDWFERYLRLPRDNLIVHKLPIVTGGLSISKDSPRLLKIGTGKSLFEQYEKLKDLRDRYKTRYTELNDIDSLVEILDFFVDPTIKMEGNDSNKVTQIMRIVGGELIDPDSLLDYLDEFIVFFKRHFCSKEPL